MAQQVRTGTALAKHPNSVLSAHVRQLVTAHNSSLNLTGALFCLHENCSQGHACSHVHTCANTQAHTGIHHEII